jgi:aryl-alcohol dehydrogenase-like predicted oxidoreductase
MKLLNGIGLGTFPFTGAFRATNKVLDKSASAKILHAFLDECGKYIDTAPTYSDRAVEEFLGVELAKRPRDSFFINTSCGYRREIDGVEAKWVCSGKRKDVIADLEGSLQRLKLDYVDLYISHIPDEDTPFEETIETMKDLKKQGKIKAIGVSNVNLEQLKRYNYDGVVKYIQNRFSLLNRSFDDEFQKYCENNNIGIIAYQVLERGLLTGKSIEGQEIITGDLRASKPEFGDLRRPVLEFWVRSRLYPIANEFGISIATLAMKAALGFNYISLCQCGVTQIENLAAFKDVNEKKTDKSLLDRVNSEYMAFEQNVRQNFNMSIREFMGLLLPQTWSADGKTVNRG